MTMKEHPTSLSHGTRVGDVPRDKPKTSFGRTDGTAGTTGTGWGTPAAAGPSRVGPVKKNVKSRRFQRVGSTAPPGAQSVCRAIVFRTGAHPAFAPGS